MGTLDEISADEAMDVVSRRAEFLEQLLDGPKYNRDIRAELGVSRSTAYKGLTELEKWHLIDRAEDGYVPTLLGRLLFEEYRRFCSNVESLCRPAALLPFIPVDADITPDVLDGTNVYLAERHAPNRPVSAIEEMVAGASALKGTGPVVLPSYVRLFHELIVEAGLEAEFVFERPVLDHLLADYADRITDAFETGNLEIRLTDDELAFAVLLVGEPIRQVGVIVYDQGGELRGVMTNDSDRAIDWARGMWTRHADETARVTTIADGEVEIEGESPPPER